LRHWSGQRVRAVESSVALIASRAFCARAMAAMASACSESSVIVSRAAGAAQTVSLSRSPWLAACATACA
jgi:hypothetical protein